MAVLSSPSSRFYTISAVDVRSLALPRPHMFNCGFVITHVSHDFYILVILPARDVSTDSPFSSSFFFFFFCFVLCLNPTLTSWQNTVRNRSSVSSTQKILTGARRIDCLNFNIELKAAKLSCGEVNLV